MQKINIKKVTKEQMLKMLEEAAEKQEAAEAEASAHFKDGVKLAEENEKLRGEIGTMTEKLDQMNGEAITRENMIANLKADADALRNKLADTEAALGKVNADLAHQIESNRTLTFELHREGVRVKALECKLANREEDLKWAKEHPWKHLWECLT